MPSPHRWPAELRTTQTAVALDLGEVCEAATEKRTQCPVPLDTAGGREREGEKADPRLQQAGAAGSRSQPRGHQAAAGAAANGSSCQISYKVVLR